MTRLMSSFLATLMILCGTAQPGARHVLAQQAQEPGQQAGGPPRYKGYGGPLYKDVSVSSVYVPMPDGTRIAIDVLLPKDLPATDKIPALLNITRYWRAKENQPPADFQKFFVQHGYALIMVDVRGTGASSGVWTMPWSKDELKDYGKVVDWVVAQPWSNGKVGAFGSSYGGNSAQLLAAVNHPAVKAVLPRHYEFDEFTDVPFPGGIFNEWMVKAWDESNHELDKGEGVKPVEGDKDRSLLRRALAEHAKNIELFQAARQITFRDDRFGGVTLDDISIQGHRQEIERSQVPISNWGGWFDAGTADAVIKSFLTFSNPQRAVIGPWNHGASQNASPYFSVNSQRLSIGYEWLRFFDQHLKGIETDVDAGKALFYNTIGEERWKKTTVWPVAGTKMVRWHMAGGNSLSTSAPTEAAGADTYQVDFEATTGDKNRWRTQLGGPVIYPDRAEADRRLLTYTSQPLTEDTEITGYPVVNLYITSTHSDGAFFVYLEEVDEAGKVTYLTEGQLRAIHRKVSNDAPPYVSLVPYHTFKKKDAMPLVPGETTELKFGLLPTSVLVRKGHRIRVAIAGHDKSVFARTPAEGTPVISVARNKQYASFIELPIVSRQSQAAPEINLLTYFDPNAGKAAVKLDPKIYDAYAGQYELAPGFVITISREDGKLMGEAPGQPKVELLPESEVKFSIKEANMQITFIKEGQQVSGLILTQSGKDMRAKKVK
ncbi:MAG TPA: CocE/NonD family hydrolase [Pyrinomonadaceae bacterium]|nr:CocE/NonD family hydrolase [Pyrinomonadaceae bacterium]